MHVSTKKLFFSVTPIKSVCNNLTLRFVHKKVLKKKNKCNRINTFNKSRFIHNKVVYKKKKKNLEENLKIKQKTINKMIK